MSDHPLELSPAGMRDLVEAALARIVAHIESLPFQPAADTRGGFEAAAALAEPMPETGAPVPGLLDLLFEKAVPPSLNTAGPGYLAYIPGGGLFQAAVADLIAESVNRYTSIYATAPALARIEMNVVDWFRQIVGFPPEARGTLTSGGSLANWTALVTARRERLPENFLSGTLYTSDQAHHSLAKGALLAGFPEGNVRAVATDDLYRLRPDALAERIAEDRRRGLQPFLIAASAGTTNSGAVDPLPELADLAAREGMWLHVDAAYGGFFLLTAEGRRAMRGIERADSLVLDPHKGLFLPYGTGAVLVRDGAALRRAHSLTGDYMPGLQDDDSGRVDFSQCSPELSRPFRGLRVWLPFKMHGAGAFRAQLEEKLALARLAADRLRATPGIEILAEPQLSLLAFRLAPQGTAEDDLEDLNRRFLDRINARQRVFLTATRLRGRLALRICVLSFRTHRDRLEMALEDVEAARREVLGTPSGGRQ